MAETVELPIVTLPDGRPFIAAQDLVERPEVAAAVARLPNWWTEDIYHQGVVGPGAGRVS